VYLGFSTAANYRYYVSAAPRRSSWKCQVHRSILYEVASLQFVRHPRFCSSLLGTRCLLQLRLQHSMWLNSTFSSLPSWSTSPKVRPFTLLPQSTDHSFGTKSITHCSASQSGGRVLHGYEKCIHPQLYLWTSYQRWIQEVMPPAHTNKVFPAKVHRRKRIQGGSPPTVFQGVCSLPTEFLPSKTKNW
jgi:hypothetical protein